MGNKFAALHSTFSVENEIVENDTRFLKVIIDSMHTGKNLNGSYFEKSVVDKCVESVKNTPILGFIKQDKFTGENDFNGHEYVLKRTENGVEEMYVGRAFGVVPESCNPRWVMKICDDGIEREFLRVDGLMWEKFSEATDIVRRDGEKAESMELSFSSVDGYEDEDGIFYFTDFKFDGFCLLGDDVQPAMVGANVKINDGVNFTMSDIADSIRSELNDKLELFNVAFAKFTNDETCDNQGGAKNMLDTDLNQVEEITLEVDEAEGVEAEFEAAIETETEVDAAEDAVEFEATEETEPEVEDEVEAEADEKVEEAAEAEAVDEAPAEEEAVEFEADESDEAAEVETDVEAVVEEPNFSEMQTEFEALKTDYAKIKADFDEMASQYEKVKSEYELIKSEYDEIKPKYDEYVLAEAQRIAEELSAQKDAAFAEFECDLSDNAEFAALKEKKDDMSVEDIEKECAFLYVKVNRAKSKFSAVEPQSAVVGVLSDVDPVESDGLVLTKYGYISTRR